MRKYLSSLGLLVALVFESPLSFAALTVLEEGVVRGAGRLKQLVSSSLVCGFSTSSGESRFARATLDSSFKAMLSDAEIQMSFLKAFTGRNDIVEVHPVSLAVPALAPEYVKGKGQLSQRHMDFACRLENGDFFIAEAQIKRETTWDARALYYAAGVYSQQLKAGAPWTMLRNVVGINILDHDTGLLTKAGDYQRHYKMVDILHPELTMPYIQIMHFELPRVLLETMEESLKKQWLTLFMRSMEMDAIPEDFDPSVQKAMGVLDRTNWAEALRREYEAEELDLSWYSEALEAEHTEGRMKGKLEKAREIALRMLKRKRPIEEIIEDTGLSKEVLESLKGS